MKWWLHKKKHKQVSYKQGWNHFIKMCYFECVCVCVCVCVWGWGFVMYVIRDLSVCVAVRLKLVVTVSKWSWSSLTVKQCTMSLSQSVSGTCSVSDIWSALTSDHWRIIELVFLILWYLRPLDASLTWAQVSLKSNVHFFWICCLIMRSNNRCVVVFRSRWK